MAQVKSGQAKVVVRRVQLSLLLWINIRAIIIDEEHEGYYKQGQSRYHARDVACLGLKVMELCLSWSATPSIETRASSKGLPFS